MPKQYYTLEDSNDENSGDDRSSYSSDRYRKRPSDCKCSRCNKQHKCDDRHRKSEKDCKCQDRYHKSEKDCKCDKYKTIRSACKCDRCESDKCIVIKIRQCK